MRIVQTFWTGGQDPLKYGFGWPHAEYNLMSWALSCLSLLKHYDEVVLYTDSAGKRILIDELHLPYTDVQVVFDDAEWLPQHWALAKIKTYSLQTKPFLHVDGDIYVPRPLPEEILSAPLIAQNREIGTIYYRRMMDRILSYPEILIPEYIQKALSEESIPSYNMGFFGGSDLAFIRHYCDEAFRFMEENRMNDPSARCSRVTCNIFFEQILFTALVDKENREVASVLGKVMTDKGYMLHEFCDLAHFDAHPFHHLLGGHKRKREVNEALAEALMRESPDMLWKIISLFPDHHVRLAKESVYTADLSVERCIGQYEDFLREAERRWIGLPVDELFATEQRISACKLLANPESRIPDDAGLEANPYMACFDIPLSWPQRTKTVLNERFGRAGNTVFSHILVIATLWMNGYREVPTGNLERRMVSLLEGKSLSFHELQEQFISSFKQENETMREGFKKLSLQLIKQLIKERIILMKK